MDKLIVYLDHAFLEMDNNLVEKAIRPTVLGRKNFMFSGSHEGSQRSAMIYSFFDSFKMNDVNPFADSLLNTNSALVDSSVSDEFEKSVNEIYLETIAKENYKFSPDQISELEFISSQCPFSSGSAVFKARSLYALINDSIDYDDYVICALNGISPRLTSSQSKNFKIFPNPASGKINLSYALQKNEQATLKVFNIFGISLLQRSMNWEESEISLNIEKLTPGIYYFAIFKNDKQVNIEKVVVFNY